MNLRKIALYLLLSYGISWGTALITWLADIKMNEMPGSLLIGGLFMWGPALAVFIVQKGIYKEPLADYGFSVKNFDYRFFFGSILTPVAAILVFAGVVFLLGNIADIPGFGKISLFQDAIVDNIRNMTAGLGEDKQALAEAQVRSFPAWAFLGLNLLSGIVAGLTINLLFTFGEEFGWRGLLLREMKPLGFWKGNTIIGIIWGLWHAPLIIQGHNYPGSPYWGVIMMCFFCISIAYPIAYMGEKTGSILGASAFHGVLNGIAGIGLLIVKGANSLLAGPAGIATVIAFLLITAGIRYFDPTFFKSEKIVPEIEKIH
ncbi:MAG: CPBP family glutamic-type intramembrane protease [Bacteroidia bacterium]|nr:CPBP family glutamic-type intramembrane protease [Bacteroidia bacterium]